MVNKRITATLNIYGITDINDDGVDDLAMYTFSFPDCYFEFKISDIESDSPNVCYIKIYGISKDTYKIFDEKRFAKYDKKQNAEILLGYDGNEELVYSGTVSRVKYNFNFGEQSMEILLDKNTKKFKNIIKSICLRNQTNILDALEVICPHFGYELQCSEPDVFRSIQIKPTTLEGNMEDCIKALVGNKGSYYVGNSTIILYSKNKEIKVKIPLTFENGLISFPSLDTRKTKNSERYRIKSTLLPNIKVGTTISIPIDKNGDYSTEYTGIYVDFVVREYVSKFSNNGMTTEMECDKISG